jgi:hypothetical protein
MPDSITGCCGTELSNEYVTVGDMSALLIFELHEGLVETNQNPSVTQYG